MTKRMKCYECGETLKFTCDNCGTANWMWGKSRYSINCVSVVGLVTLIFMTGFALGVWL